ncbi:hypothetical protein D3C75_492550 [compost metagenome]
MAIGGLLLLLLAVQRVAQQAYAHGSRRDGHRRIAAGELGGDLAAGLHRAKRGAGLDPVAGLRAEVTQAAASALQAIARGMGQVEGALQGAVGDYGQLAHAGVSLPRVEVQCRLLPVNGMSVRRARGVTLPQPFRNGRGCRRALRPARLGPVGRRGRPRIVRPRVARVTALHLLLHLGVGVLPEIAQILGHLQRPAAR